MLENMETTAYEYETVRIDHLGMESTTKWGLPLGVA
jgi:hypothetical protein